jgi:cobalt-zinc-cadmium resistance protein CzcA
LRLAPFYDRGELVTAALATVLRALVEGGLFVTLVVVLFLGRLHSALVVIVILIVAPLATFIGMRVFGLSANIMSLGGLAISLGMIVDPAIIQVENVERHVHRMADVVRQSVPERLRIVRQAVLEVRKPSLFGELIIALTFVPVLSLVGMEGKLFTPLALTIMLALFVSLLLSFTLAPVLCFVLIRRTPHRDTALVRWVSRAYEPVLHWSIAHRRLVLSAAAGLLCCALALVPFLGTEFIPIMTKARSRLRPSVCRVSRYPSRSKWKSRCIKLSLSFLKSARSSARSDDRKSRTTRRSRMKAIPSSPCIRAIPGRPTGTRQS